VGVEQEREVKKERGRQTETERQTESRRKPGIIIKMALKHKIEEKTRCTELPFSLLHHDKKRSWAMIDQKQVNKSLNKQSMVICMGQIMLGKLSSLE
jgi:hypothetical protein